jgi:hypothetical protein
MRKSLIALAALTIALAAQLLEAGAQSLQTWSGTIAYKHKNYSFKMVGTDPATTNTTTTITPYIIPIKMVYSDGTVFDPMVDTWGGVSVVDAVKGSPLFQTMDWQWDGTDMGVTQYEDAFQRGSFWQDVSVNTNYHVVFAQPTVLPEQVINVGSDGQVVVSNGQAWGQMDKTDFKNYLQTYLTDFGQINPSVLPIFVTDNIGLCDLGMCGQPGYHTFISDQTYVWSSFITYIPDQLPSSLPPDISSLTHELGEWMDDPYVLANSSPCGYLEVGDPLEGHWITRSSSFPWHLQALAFMQFFGEPTGFSANSWYDDVNYYQSVCGQ